MGECATELRSFDLRAIISALSKINVFSQKSVGDQVVKVLAEALSTDRITFALIDHNTNHLLATYTLGLSLPHGHEMTAGKLMTKALLDAKPLVYSNVRDYPELTAMWADEYKTNACAILPVTYQGIRMGALCLSNLTDEQVIAMQSQRRELELFGSMMGMIAAFQVGYSAAQGNRQMQLVLQRLSMG